MKTYLHIYLSANVQSFPPHIFIYLKDIDVMGGLQLSSICQLNSYKPAQVGLGQAEARS